MASTKEVPTTKSYADATILFPHPASTFPGDLPIDSSFCYVKI